MHLTVNVGKKKIGTSAYFRKIDSFVLLYLIFQIKTINIVGLHDGF